MVRNCLSGAGGLVGLKGVRPAVWAVLLGAGLACRAADRPAYALRVAGGTLEVFHGSASDPRFEATLDGGTDGNWRLKVRSLGPRISELWFPYEEAPSAIGETAADDVLFFPHLMGQARRVASLDETKWDGRSYPGLCFAPLAIIADESGGRMVAATNWPPRKVFVAYARGRIGLRYDDFLAERSEATVSALVMTSEGGPGRPAWHEPLDRYRTFLNKGMADAGLYPIAYPGWMREIHGWQNVQLQNYRDEDLPKVLGNWKRYRAIFPWIQMWGQMSNFFPSPPEETGCCLQKQVFHNRYQSLLAALKQEVRSGEHLGFYVRPESPYRPFAGEGPEVSRSRVFLTDWISKNTSHGANAHYLDVCGAQDFGPPLQVAKMFGHELPRECVIEMPIDVYPAAFLVSGCLWGGSSCRTSPGQEPSDLSERLDCASFPRFGRYLLNDRMFFLGESNGDHTSWGNSRGHQYWTERQAFLLGAKFDAMRVADDEKRPEQLNRALELILGERMRVGWWKLDPVYLDTAGLTDVPDGVEVRRFTGNNGDTLLAVDNWSRRPGRFRFKGVELVLPTEQVRVVVNPLEGGR